MNILLCAPTVSLKSRPCRRDGQSLVEFALVSIVLYTLLAAILTFGHMLYVAQGLQTAADLAAREISRTPLDPEATFEDSLSNGSLDEIYSRNYLVFDLSTLGDKDFFRDVIPTWPLVNQQLATMMIVDGGLLRYPGALLTDSTTPTGYTVEIPIVVARGPQGAESIRWVSVVEEIDTEENDSDDSGANPDPFQVTSTQRGLVALRINYPFQSASMSGFRSNVNGPYEPNVGSPNVADDGEVTQVNSPSHGALRSEPLESNGIYAGTYGGAYGLGAQGAMRGDAIISGRPLRPFRRVLSAQAIYRREIFQ